MRVRRSRRRAAKPFDHGTPIWRPNMAAVASVFFCLPIVWAVMSVQPVQHVFYIDVPVESSGPLGDLRPHWGPDPRSPANTLHVTENDMLMWNGEAISRGQLVSNLHNGLMSEIEPELYFSAAPNASYEVSAKALHIVRYSGITKFTFVDLEQHQHFSKREY